MIKRIMKKVLMLGTVLIFIVSCTTVSKQEMAYLGDDTEKENISGSVKHIDWFGINLKGTTYIQEYNEAIDKAKEKAASENLVNLKAFKEHKIWPQATGILLTSVGVGLGTFNTFLDVINLSGEGVGVNYFLPVVTVIGFIIAAGGVGLTGINIYDYVIIAEPGN